MLLEMPVPPKGSTMKRTLAIRLIAVGICLLGSVSTLSAYTAPAATLTALDKLRGYSELTTAAGSMDIDKYTYNLTTWQMTHGGFSKAHASLYVSPWNGTAELSSWTGTNSEPLGMYDNNATVQEMRLLAVRYKATTNTTYKAAFKASFNKAVGFVLASQLPNGGWPQVYPKRGNYSDMATYNDNAMIRLMVLVKDMVDKKAPFDSDITPSDSLAKLNTALTKAVNFALKAQIVNSGKPTVWCAQHDPSTYKPVAARAYELASKSGSESIPVVWFLMAWPDQSTAVQTAVKGAIAWIKATKVSNTQFDSGSFYTVAGKNMWYRFYEVDNDNYFFCDRAGESTKTQDITKLSDDRRYGYQWAGDYGSATLAMESAYLTALSTSSVNPSSGPCQVGAIHATGNRLTAQVSQDGLYEIQFVDLRGAIQTSLMASSASGVVVADLPADVRRGIAYVRLSKVGGAPLAVHRIVVP